LSPDNGHGHLVYRLRNAVYTAINANPTPQRYLDAIEDAYTERLAADPGYAGLITKNPWHSHWRTIEDGNAVYMLDELASYIELESGRKSELKHNIKGRNCTLFDSLRQWAYSAIRGYWKPEGAGVWLDALTAEARRLNILFDRPLDGGEVRHIVRSVWRWTWRHLTPDSFGDFIEKTHTPEAQRARRAKRTEKESKKAEGLKMLEAGQSRTNIAKALEISVKTVQRWRASTKD
jgi:hypothetical protein